MPKTATTSSGTHHAVEVPNNALLSKEDYPSWAYEIGKGATTIWERWNSIQPDGSFGPVDTNSFNYYAC